VTSQPGWHPDPVPPSPGQPAQLRYWDGTRWTEHTAPAQAPAASQGYGAPPAYGGTYGAAPAHPGTYGAAYAGTKPPATTPDGVPLAGWWHRAGAYLLDSIIVGIIAAAFAMPWIRDAFHIYTDWFDELLRTTEAGTTSTVDTAQLQRDLARPLAFILGIQLVVSFCYHVGFLMWKQATPGKLMVGLRVRLRETPGRMPLGTVTLRWLGQFGVGVFGLIPFVGSLTGIYTLLDVLWPLWDDKKQAVHDKVAKTNVVRVR
jgi:uncharacterized RDD family membrane protein YckC